MYMVHYSTDYMTFTILVRETWNDNRLSDQAPSSIFWEQTFKRKDIYSNFLLIKFQRPNKIHGICFQRYVYCVFTYLCAESYLIYV